MMADYYTMFSTTISYQTEDQRDWLLDKLGSGVIDDNDGESYPVCDIVDEPGDQAIWVYENEGGGDLDALFDIVAEFQKLFSIETPWHISWANTCSKPRLEAFGGGAVFIHKGELAYMSTDSWIAQKYKKENDVQL